MTKSTSSTTRFLHSRGTAIATSIAVTVAGVLSLGVPASANTVMAPEVTFDINILSNSWIAPEIGERLVEGELELRSRPLERVLQTDRPGYSFGGWSYVVGGPATKILYADSATSTRVNLIAVWNTSLTLDKNGATKGDSTSVDYRFGQTLDLPGAGKLKKSGYTFVGWAPNTEAPIVQKTYRAGVTDNGNPTFFATWGRTVVFKVGGAQGTLPGPLTYLAGGDRLVLPSGEGLSRSGFEFVGWSTTPRGKAIKKSNAYLPKTAKSVLFAVWKKN
jgi:Listeria-Bacteroides repeat domain (List_Bact_rpt)